MLFKESYASREARYDRETKEMGKAHGTTARDYGTDANSILEYTYSSGSLNRSLLKGEPLSYGDKLKHEAVLNQSRPAGFEKTLYSGTSHNFGEMVKQTEGGIIHSPAHMSATNSFKIAKWFATKRMKNDNADAQHILKIHVKPHDKVLAIGHTFSGGEHEVIIPAGTKLKYHGTKTKMIPKTFDLLNGKANDVDVPHHFHHFTIHSQE